MASKRALAVLPGSATARAFIEISGQIQAHGWKIAEDAVLRYRAHLATLGLEHPEPPDDLFAHQFLLPKLALDDVTAVIERHQQEPIGIPAPEQGRLA